MTNTHFLHTLERAEQFVLQGLVPSLCIGFGCGDAILGSACYGKESILPKADSVDANTLYDMASLTKLLGPTMVALQLLADGTLELSDTLFRYLGNLVPEEKRGISIFHLMTHTAGFLPSVRMEKLFSEPERVLPFILSTPLQQEPGSKVSYSCLGYIVLGKVLERITGKDLHQLTQEYVFSPLQMTNTGYHPLNSTIHSEHTAYTERAWSDGEWLVGRVHDENAFLLQGISGNAGIFSTLNDCMRFARMIACSGVFDGKVYLSSSILKSAMTDQVPWSDNHKGLGFDLSGGRTGIYGPFFSIQAAGHTGFTGTSLYVDPETGLWLVILANRVHPTRDNLEMPRIRRVLGSTLRAEFDVWSHEHENAH